MNSKETLRLPDRKSICVERVSARNKVMTFISKNSVEVRLTKSNISKFLSCKNQGSCSLKVSSDTSLKILDFENENRVMLLIVRHLDKGDKKLAEFKLTRKHFRKLCRIVKEVFEYGE